MSGLDTLPRSYQRAEEQAIETTKAQNIQLGRAQVATRNPWGLWLLIIITLGIWGVVWWYQINREMRDYSEAVGRPFGNSPVLATLAVIPGALFVIPVGWIFILPLLTLLFTARRLREVQSWISPEEKHVNPLLAILLAILLWSHSVYFQKALNEAWLRAGSGKGPPTTAKPKVLAEDEVRTASEARDETVQITRRIGRG